MFNSINDAVEFYINEIGQDVGGLTEYEYFCGGEYIRVNSNIGLEGLKNLSSFQKFSIEALNKDSSLLIVSEKTLEGWSSESSSSPDLFGFRDEEKEYSWKEYREEILERSGLNKISVL